MPIIFKYIQFLSKKQIINYFKNIFKWGGISKTFYGVIFSKPSIITIFISNIFYLGLFDWFKAIRS